MKTILRYELKIDDSQIIEVPKGSRFLSLKNHETLDIPVFWALVETENEPEDLEILMFASGNNITEDPTSLNYLDTFLYKERHYFHCFVKK